MKAWECEPAEGVWKLSSGLAGQGDKGWKTGLERWLEPDHEVSGM